MVELRLLSESHSKPPRWAWAAAESAEQLELQEGEEPADYWDPLLHPF